MQTSHLPVDLTALHLVGFPLAFVQQLLSVSAGQAQAWAAGAACGRTSHAPPLPLCTGLSRQAGCPRHLAPVASFICPPFRSEPQQQQSCRKGFQGLHSPFHLVLAPFFVFLKMLFNGGKVSMKKTENEAQEGCLMGSGVLTCQRLFLSKPSSWETGLPVPSASGGRRWVRGASGLMVPGELRTMGDQRPLLGPCGHLMHHPKALESQSLHEVCSFSTQRLKPPLPPPSHPAPGHVPPPPSRRASWAPAMDSPRTPAGQPSGLTLLAPSLTRTNTPGPWSTKEPAREEPPQVPPSQRGAGCPPCEAGVWAEVPSR